MSAIISPSDISSAVSVPLEYLLADVERDADLMGYFVTRIEHYKEINTVAHEFLVITLFNGFRSVRIMIERRPSTKKPPGIALLQGSSYVRVTDDSLSRVNDDFDASKYHHISTITCSFQTRFSLKDLCNCCHAINLHAPNYRLSSTHCYWFCASFLALAERGWLMKFERGRDHDRGGTFRGIRVVKISAVRKSVAGWPPVNKSAHAEDPTGAQSSTGIPGPQPDPEGQAPWVLDKIILGHKDKVMGIAVTQHQGSGRLSILSGYQDATVRLWDAETGVQMGWTLAGHTGTVRSVAISPDGRYGASASDDKTVRIWDLETGKTAHRLEGGIEVRCVTFSPDGRMVAAGLKDMTVRLWNVETGAAVGIPMLHDGRPVQQVWGVAFSPDGKRLVSGSRNRTLRIWDTETFRSVRTLTGHTSGVLSVAYSPDGSKISSGSESGENAIFIWDAATGEILRQLYGHRTSLFSVAWSPDGKQIVSGSEDWTVRVWDIETGTQVGGYLHGHRYWVHSAVFSPDGRHIVTGSADSSMRIWRPM